MKSGLFIGVVIGFVLTFAALLGAAFYINAEDAKLGYDF
jgi:hypothetical protein